MPEQKSKEPLVSVILPAYNCGPYLADALESVTNQTYTNLEIIVVDDGSKDNTWEVLQACAIKDERIKPIRHEINAHIVVTLNDAIAASKGKYLARMDGDDIRELDSIAKQVTFLEEHPDVVVVGGSAMICDGKMKPLNVRTYNQTDAEIRSKMFRYSPFCHATLLFRASAMEPAPYRLALAEDYDLYFRLAKQGKMANLSDVLYNVRTHPESDSQVFGRKQEKLTLYIRLKAVFEYGYTMSRGDKIYFAMQFLTMWAMPPRFRFWLFNKIRAQR